MNRPDNTITKEAFTGIIKAILDFSDMQHQFANDMDKYLDGHFITEFGRPLTSAMIDGLEHCFKYGAPGGIISWWLWDAPDSGKDKDSAKIGNGHGIWYSLETADLLYEYLTTGKTSVTTTAPVDPPHNPNFGK